MTLHRLVVIRLLGKQGKCVNITGIWFVLFFYSANV